MATTAKTPKARMMEKVRALLTQAEDPAVTEQEAQAFAAKAAELMARYSLDEATVRAANGQKAELVKVLKFEVSGQGWHGKARATLVYLVAQAYGCEVCTVNNKMNGETRWVAIVGTASAVTSLELLLPSIVLQAEANGVKATKAHMEQVGRTFDTQANRNIARRVFFRSYLPGFGIGVAEKITAFRDEIVKEVADQPGALVLASDAERVKADFDRRFPDLKVSKSDSHSPAGAIAGLRDGRNADTGTGNKVGGGKRAVTKK
ncbi:MAG: DUF2786 domain-containing protein [Umezawaea sp.]